MKYTLLLLAIACWGICCKDKTTTNVSISNLPFPNVAYTKAVAYVYAPSDGASIVSRTGQLHHTAQNECELLPEQTKTLLNLLNDSKTYGDNVMRCFTPTIGIVFYDAQEKTVAHISFSFACNNHNASSAIGAASQNPANLLGFSREGKSKLLEFEKSLSWKPMAQND